MKKIEILRVLVGSHAHGLADKDSDKDYRAVYVLPASELLSLDYKYKGTMWIEGDQDNTAYEIGHFLNLAIHCNPTILEVFKAPVMHANLDGTKLRALFPHVWNPQKAFDAFCGYSFNQRKKFLDKKDNRENKYACAYIRTLDQLIQLLASGDFSAEVKNPKLKKDLRNYRKGVYTFGDIINQAEKLTETARQLLENCKHKQNIRKVNEFLIKIRKKYWA